jgi:hypothetical protein
MPTVARLTLQVDVDGAAAARAQLEVIDKLLKSRAASWSQLAGRFVTETDSEGSALNRLARTAETSNLRISRSTEIVHRRQSSFGNVLGVVGQQVTRMAARAAILSNVLIPLAAAAFQVGAALTPIVGLAGALPGILVAGGLAAATAGLAFSGMGDALKAMSAAQDGTEASAEKLAEAMRNLPPAARPVVRQLFEMRGMVTRLRETAAAGVMPGVAATLRGLATLFPIVRQAVAATSREFGALGERLGRLARLPSFQRDLQAVLGDGAQLTRNFGNAGIYLAQAFLNVAVVARPLVQQFGRLVEWAAAGAHRFTESARASGAMARFFRSAADTAEQLFAILTDVVVIIVNLGRIAAPSGKGLLDTLEGLLDRAARASYNLDRLRGIVLAAADAFAILRLALLGAAFGPWGIAIGAAAGVLLVIYRRSEAFRDGVERLATIISRAVMPAFRDLVGWVRDQLLPAIERVIPYVRDQLFGAFNNLSRALGENQGEFAKVGRIIVQVGGWLLTRLLPAAIRVGAFVGARLVDNVSRAIRIFGFIVRTIQTVVNVFGAAIRAVGDFIAFTARAWNTLTRTTSATWEGVRRVVVGALVRVGTTIRSTASTVTGFLSRAWETVSRITRATWDWFYRLIVGNITRVVAEIRKSIVALIPQSVRNAWNSVTRATGAAWDRFRSIVTDALRQVLRFLTGQWNAMLRDIRGTWNRMAAIVRDGWNAVTARTREAWNTVVRWVRDGTRRALETISGWGRSVRSFFSGMIRDATGWGSRIWRNVRDGIGSIDIGGVVRRSLNAAIGLINRMGGAFARGANIILPGSPIQWPGIPLLRQTGGEIPGLARGDRVPILGEGGEIMIRSQVAQPLRNMLLAINRLPASSARALARELAGARNPDIAGDISRMIVSHQPMSRPDRQGVRFGFQKGGELPQLTGLIGRTQSWIRAQDPKPYIWGGVGPGGFDCSGIAGSVYALLTGQNPHRRYFTTSSIPAGTSMRPGRGTYTVGVTAGTGHMAANLAGLPFEARSSRSGIIVGPAARSVTSFARQFYLPQAGGRFIGGGGIDFLGLLSRLLNRLTAPLRAALGRTLGSGPDDMLGQLVGGMGNQLISGLTGLVSGGIGMQGGGTIREPIVGLGRSGSLYRFGERGPETVTAGVGGGGTAVYNFNVSLTGTYAEPITMADVHGAIGQAVGMLRATQAKGTAMGRT